MTNIRIVDVVYDGQGYRLDDGSKAVGTRVCRATKQLQCPPRGCGRSIKRGDYYLYCRGEGRMCLRCAKNLMAIVPVEAPT